MSQAQPTTAKNVNDIAEITGKTESRDEAHHALKSALSAYAAIIEDLYQQPHSVKSVEVDSLFADLDQAHKNWMAISGVAIKPM